MAKVKVKGKVYELPEDLTLGEAKEVERISGAPFGESSGLGVTIALLYLAMRAVDPETTLEQVENLKESEFEEVEEDEAGPPARKTSKKKKRA